RPAAADIMLNMGLTRGYTMLGLTEREAKASAPKTVLWPISERGPRVVRSQYGHRADNSSSHLGARHVLGRTALDGATSSARAADACAAFDAPYARSMRATEN